MCKNRYNASDMQNTTSLKIVIFGIEENKLLVLLQNNRLIKDIVSADKDLNELAKETFTGITEIPLKESYIEQLYTFRDNKKEISIVYYILLSEKKNTLSLQFQWKDIKNLKKTDEDYPIIEYAVQRLRWKIEYTNIIYSLLPQTFTLPQLQKAYETIFGKALDKRNFRKKILSLNFLVATGQKNKGTTRPALTYRFKRRTPTIVKVFS